MRRYIQANGVWWVVQMGDREERMGFTWVTIRTYRLEEEGNSANKYIIERQWSTTEPMGDAEYIKQTMEGTTAKE